MSKPSRDQVAQWGRQADKIAQPLTHSWDVELCAIARYDLEATIESLRQQLAECQATNGKLREALKHIQNATQCYINGKDILKHTDARKSLIAALALPNDATALNELIEAKVAERTAEVEKQLDAMRKAWNVDELIAERTKDQPDFDDPTHPAFVNGYKVGFDSSYLHNKITELTKQRDAAMTTLKRIYFFQEDIEHPPLKSVAEMMRDMAKAAIANCKEQG